MSLDLFVLSHKLRSEGMSEAQAALAKVDTAGRAAAVGLSKTESAFDRTTKKIEESRVKFDAWQRQLAQNQGAVAHVTAVNSMAKAHDAATVGANRLRGGLATLAAQATGMNPALSSLTSIIGSLAFGGVITSGVLIGIAAIAFAYDKLTASTRKAKEETEDYLKSLRNQEKAAKDASVSGSKLREEQARQLFLEAKAAQLRFNETGGGPSWQAALVSNRVTAAAHDLLLAKAAAAKIAAAADMDIARAGMASTAAMDAATKSTERGTRAIRDRTEALGELSKLQGPHIGITPEGFTPSILAGGMPNVPESAVKPPTFIAKYEQQVVAAMAEMQQTLAAAADELGMTVGDAIYNAFASAFSGGGIGGAIKAFGKTILAGLGTVFKMIGEQVIVGSAIMVAIKKALMSWNPALSLAAGIALVALGGAIGGMAAGGAQRGFSSIDGSGGNFARGTEEIVRYKFVNRDGSMANVAPMQPIHFTVIGAHDPVAQREIVNLITNANRRRG